MAACPQSLFDIVIADVAVFAAGSNTLGTLDSAYANVVFCKGTLSSYNSPLSPNFHSFEKSLR